MFKFMADHSKIIMCGATATYNNWGKKVGVLNYQNLRYIDQWLLIYMVYCHIIHEFNERSILLFLTNNNRQL